MTLTTENLIKSPAGLHHEIMEDLVSKIDGADEIVDPTNPLSMVVETMVMVGHGLLTETSSIYTNIYPALADSSEKLYGHLYDEQYKNIFYTPATGFLLFHLNVNSLISNGIKSEDGEYVSLRIPRYTYIQVDGDDYTLLNSVYIKYFIIAGNAEIIYEESDDELSFKQFNVLDYAKYRDGKNGLWITFGISIKQLTVTSVTKNVIRNTPTSFDVSLSDKKYHYATVLQKNDYTDNKWVKIPTTHNITAMSSDKPAIQLVVEDNNLKITVPNVYISNKSIFGLLKVLVYTTEGKIVKNLQEIASPDFKIYAGEVLDDIESAKFTNVVTRVDSQTPVNGGTNGMSIDDIRELIISSVYDSKTPPISESTLKSETALNGYELVRAKEIFTDRVFVGLKPIPKPKKSDKVKLDVFNGLWSFILTENESTDTIININDTQTVIKKNTIFKYENGKLSALSDYEVDYLKNLTSETLYSYLLKNNVYITPYHYVSDITSGFHKFDCYDFNLPKVSNLTVVSSTDLGYKINISTMGVVLKDTGFEITILVVGNDEFKKLQQNNLRAQLSLTGGNGVTKIYLHEWMSTTNVFKFKLETDFLVVDDILTLLNGVSDIPNIEIPLITNAEFIVYSIGDEIPVSNYNVFNEILYDDSTGVSKKPIVKQSFTINLGSKIENLLSVATLAYGDRIFKRYQDDVFMKYTETQYVVDENTGLDYHIPDNLTSCDEITRVVLHEKGDVVLDDNGNSVILHNKNDVILDSDGEPIIDETGSVIRYMNILLYEYVFHIADNVPQIDGLKKLKETINGYLTTELNDLNDMLLDNTRILYAPNRRLNDVVVTAGVTEYYIKNMLSLDVLIYVVKNSPLLSEDTRVLRGRVGKIIHEHLDLEKISLEDIKNEIKSTLGTDVVSITISGLDGGNNLEFFIVKEKTTKLTLKKRLDFDSNNIISVEYDIGIQVTSL
jgi:hypothetical protein